jgi:hypothetical protein
MAPVEPGNRKNGAWKLKDDGKKLATMRKGVKILKNSPR